MEESSVTVHCPLYYFTENETYSNLTEDKRESDKKQNFPQIVIQVGA